MEATLEKDKIEIIKWIAGLKDRAAIERIKLFKRNPSNPDLLDEDQLFGEILKKSKRSGRLSEKETKALVASLR